MNANYRSIILAVSVFFALATSISAAPGDLDPTFGVGGKVIVSGYGSYDVAIQPDGKIVTVGGAQITIARYNVDGSPDTTSWFIQAMAKGSEGFRPALRVIR